MRLGKPIEIEGGLPFGLKGDELVRPERVPNGKACGCVCPHCKAPLNARNRGRVRRPHFAHLPGQGSEECLERVLALVEKIRREQKNRLHEQAKALLMAAREVLLPAYEAKEGEVSECRDAVLWRYDHAAAEVSYKAEAGAGIRSDVVLSGDGLDLFGTDTLLVEIQVTHRVGTEKEGAARHSKWPMIEIDLSGLNGLLMEGDDLEALVLREAPRYWLSHPAADRCFAERCAEQRQKKAKAAMPVALGTLNAAAGVPGPRRSAGSWDPWVDSKTGDLIDAIAMRARDLLTQGVVNCWQCGRCGWLNKARAATPASACGQGEPLVVEMCECCGGIRSGAGHTLTPEGIEGLAERLKTHPELATWTRCRQRDWILAWRQRRKASVWGS